MSIKTTRQSRSWRTGDWVRDRDNETIWCIQYLDGDVLFATKLGNRGNRMKKHGIPVNGLELKDGKLVAKRKPKDVSARIRERNSKKVKVVRGRA